MAVVTVQMQRNSTPPESMDSDSHDDENMTDPAPDTSDSNSASVQTAHLPQSLKRFKFLAVKIASQQAQQRPSATDAGMQQLNQYLTEVQLVNSGSGIPVSALDFWKNKIDLCDKLAPVALDIVAAPASQAYVERLFSVCGLLTEGRKNQMSKSLEMRVCLKLNKKVLCAIGFL